MEVQKLRNYLRKFKHGERIDFIKEESGNVLLVIHDTENIVVGKIDEKYFI